MKQLLNEALHEIEGLRRRNEVLQAQADVVTVFSAALLGVPRSGGMAPDVAWKLRQEIAKLETPKPHVVGDQQSVRD
jgi:hypothetical protein